MCDIWRANAVAHELSPEEIERHRESLRNLSVRNAVLSGGEPLMHADLFRFCRSLLQEGICITLITSGVLLEENARQVAESCTHVVVSLDGPEKIHDRIRGKEGTFKKLARGVSALKGIRDDIAITGRCTVQRLNFEHLADTTDTARRLGLAHISFLAADISSSAFNRPQGWLEGKKSQIALSADDLPLFRCCIEEFLVRHRPLILNRFVTQQPEQLWRLWDYFAALHGLQQFPPLHCHAPWMSAVIESEGEVLPCFFQPTYGNLAGRSLGDVLNSPSAIAFRRNLNVSTNPICRRCVCSIRHGGILDRLSGGRLI